MAAATKIGSDLDQQKQRRRAVFSFGDDDDDEDTNGGFSFEPLKKDAVDRAAFAAPDFDPDRFLASRRHLGLERLKVELNSHLKFLKAELIELINRDYQDFINLSTNLKGVDRAIDDLRRPLREMESQVQKVRSHCQQTIDTLEEQLAHRAQLREKKACLKLLLNIHESVTKVEDLLEINQDADATPKESRPAIVADDSLGKQIERVAIEYNQMQHLVKRGKDLPFMAENEWRITRIKDTLQNKLSKTLRNALEKMKSGESSPDTNQSLVQCLRTYALIDQTKVAESLIREEFVRPFVAKTITRNTIGQPLTAIYSKLLNFATSDLQPILDITQKTLKGTTYDILVNSFWSELVDRLNQEGSSIYAPGQTDTFHKNYSASISFVSGIETLCLSKKSLLYLRSHPRYSEFMKRWQLPVYFQLRFREIVNGVEDLLNDPGASVDHGNVQPSPDCLALPATKAVSHAIDQCWADNVFLYSLSHRFWKLTLQLLKRYHLWANQILHYLLESPSAADKTGNGANHVYETTSILRLVILSHDIEAFIRESKHRITKTILPKLPDVDSSLLRENMDTILEEMARSTTNEIQYRVTSAFGRRCVDILKQAREITVQYRHRNKPSPTEASSFIPNAFRPYRLFFEKHQGWIDEDKQVMWGRQVGEMVLNRYTTTISDLLTNLQKSEDSLKRLKKGKKSNHAMQNASSLLGSQSGSAMSDEDKIRLQILLDVRQLGDELSVLMIDKSTFKPYAKLYEVVKPFESLENTN
ncbi:oligomeric golgi complex component, COG2-domain-containing protein [Dichotomocladium elegans]|nr:oligomeric golgi complex component, COG2-domain-containing protein [Dichotomocladium elegans]